MRYLHIIPPWYIFHGSGLLRQPNVPLGAAYCARAALSAGYDALIWNGDLAPAGKENQYSEEMTAYKSYLGHDSWPSNISSDMLDLLEDYQPDVVGISVMTPAYGSFLHTVRIIRDALSQAKIVAGGPHPSALPDETLQESKVDAVVIGEGEGALQGLLRIYKNEVPKGQVYCTSRPLDEIGWPCRGRIYDKYGLMNRDNYGTVMYARGCPYSCSFCASHKVWGRTTRWRSALDVVNEMEAIYEEYDTHYFSFADDSFTINRYKIEDLTDYLESSKLLSIPGFRWTCNTRPDAVDKDIATMVKEVGCSAVAVGIESGNPRILKKMNKSYTLDNVRRAITIIKEAGLIASGQFMVGYPTETEDEMWDTIRLADELECESIMLSVAAPLPKTALYDEAQRLGLLPDKVNWTEVTTKNDGMLMTDLVDGKIVPMAENKRLQLVNILHKEFDRIQAKTIDRKNASRRYYESQYIDEVKDAYGVIT